MYPAERGAASVWDNNSDAKNSTYNRPVAVFIVIIKLFFYLIFLLLLSPITVSLLIHQHLTCGVLDLYSYTLLHKVKDYNCLTPKFCGSCVYYIGIKSLYIAAIAVPHVI